MSDPSTAAIAIRTLPAKVHASDTAFAGSILINPGGPGASGVDFVALRGMRNGPVEKVVRAIREFPSQILALASRLSEQDHGPFPLCHGDFIHSNMIVNDHFDVTAIIDWEGSRTLPLELVAFPGFLNILPPQFGSSDRYDEEGLPMDEEERQRWNDRKCYVEMVREFEVTDNVLSTCPSNEKGLALGYLISSYENGKLGLYDEVMKRHFGEQPEEI